MHRTHGIAGFYRGLMSRSNMITASFIIFNEVKVRLAPVLFSHRF